MFRQLINCNLLKSNILQKVIFHLEAFVAKFMRIYEGYVTTINFWMFESQLIFSIGT
jgi:hypothetical protein